MVSPLDSVQLDQIFDDLASLAQTATSAPAFAEALLPAALSTTGAVAGGVWLAEGRDVTGVCQLRMRSFIVEEQATRTCEHLLRLAVALPVASSKAYWRTIRFWPVRSRRATASGECWGWLPLPRHRPGH